MWIVVLYSASMQRFTKNLSLINQLSLGTVRICTTDSTAPVIERYCDVEVYLR